jgi:hypothetical protein
VSGLRALVAATRASTPRLRPRPVSTFEATGPAVPEHDIEIESSIEPPAPLVSTPPQPSEPVQPALPTRVREVAPQNSHARSRSVAAIPPTPTPPPPPPAAPHVHPTGAPERRVAEHAVPARRRSPAPQKAHAESVVASKVLAESPSDAAPSAVGRPGPTAPPYVGVLVPPPLPTALAAPVLRAMQPPRRSPAAPAPIGAERGQPDVHVSIGRIEVLANSAPPAAPTHSDVAARRGVVGLDDYLTQRGKR